MATKLKKIVDAWPNDKMFPVDYFSYRKKPGHTWVFGPENTLMAVYAFRVSSRDQPIIEKDMEEFGQGVDLLIDALTTRTKDLTTAVQNATTAEALEKAVQLLDDTEQTKLAIQPICSWEPVNFEILQAGASSCLTKNQTQFTDCLLDIFESRLKTYGEKVCLLKELRKEVNKCGAVLTDLHLTPIDDFAALTMHSLIEFAEGLTEEVKTKYMSYNFS